MLSLLSHFIHDLSIVKIHPWSVCYGVLALDYEFGGRVVEAKSYDALQNQIWSMLPGFCTHPTDLPQVSNSTLCLIWWSANCENIFHYTECDYWEQVSLNSPSYPWGCLCDEITILNYTYLHKLLRKHKWPSPVTRLTAYFTCGLYVWFHDWRA